MNVLWEVPLHFINKYDSAFLNFGQALLKIVILFLVVQISIRVTTKVVRRTLSMRTKMNKRRRETIESMCENIFRYFYYLIFLLTILPIFNIQIGALLAGAGVVGIAIAFAAQSLLKDFFNGFFILFEDQYGVGDFVVINGVWGAVKSIGLRITTLQVWTGEVVTIPNGEIHQVTNYSKENSYAVIDVKIGYSSKIEQATEVIQHVMNELQREEEKIIGDVEVLGVQELNDWNYAIRAIAECEPFTHFEVQRLAKQRIRTALDEAGIDIPVQKIVYIHNDELPQSFHRQQA